MPCMIFSSNIGQFIWNHFILLAIPFLYSISYVFHVIVLYSILYILLRKNIIETFILSLFNFITDQDLRSYNFLSMNCILILHNGLIRTQYLLNLVFWLAVFHGRFLNMNFILILQNCPIIAQYWLNPAFWLDLFSSTRTKLVHESFKTISTAVSYYLSQKLSPQKK